MNSSPRDAAGRKPASLLPLGPWLKWAWCGLFVPGHISNQFLRFCLVGASGVAVNYLVMLASYHGLALPYVLASLVAYLVASGNNFAWNKKFTFKDKITGFGPVFRQYLKFLGVTLPGLAINEGVLVALVELSAMDPVWANLLGVLVATVSNFIGNRYFTFRSSSRPGK